MIRIIAALAGAAVVAVLAMILTMPSDADHAALTTPEFLAAYADAPGQGALDGLRFDTTMGPAGRPPEVEDYVQFDQGLFMSRECTDRCNYPPSAYLTRDVGETTTFFVEAFCPTKDTTMVWRGTIDGNTVAGTVTWTSKRLLWSTTTVLEFQGTRSDLAASLDPA